MHARICPQCKKNYVPALLDYDPSDATRANEISVKVNRWLNGAHIQDVWPHATSTEREQIQTGICSDDCWTAHLGPEE